MTGLLSRRSPIGLDVGGHSVKAVQSARAGGGGWKTVAAACFPRTRPDVPVSAAELVEIKDVLRRQGFVGDEVVVAAPAEKLRSGTLELPARGRGVPMDQIARAEFARVHKCDVAASEFCWWELPAGPRGGKATQVMAIALPHADAEQYLALFDQAGLRVTAMDAPTSALARACPAPTGEASTIAMLDLGWRCATIVVVRNGVIAYERRVVAGGLSKLHAALATRFGAGDAEVGGASLVEEFAGGDAAGDGHDVRVATEARELIVAHLGTVVDDVLKTCGYAQRQDPDAPIRTLLLAGGGACVPGVLDHLQAVLGLEVRAAESGGDGRLTPGHAVAAALATFGSRAA